MKSDADIIRDAKLEAMGLPPSEDQPRRQDKPQMATDEVVSATLPCLLSGLCDLIQNTGYGALQETDAQVIPFVDLPFCRTVS